MCISNMNRYWIIFAICASSFSSSQADWGDRWQGNLEPVTVKFSNTTVQGIQRETLGERYIDAFMGIPYAEPPVGDLRFRNPVPYVYRDVRFLADKRKPRCLQKVAIVKGDEDCLYLDVYRPRSIGNQTLPVMVYFQADDLNPSHNEVPVLGGYYLLDKDVVLVTFTYRLGLFGFLSTGDDQAPGNFGLKDQKVALQWVQSNIAAFGGDPNRVTVFGNGHGAESIHYHTLVNHTEGLFHQYILQSGTALGPWSVRGSITHMSLVIQLAYAVGCPTISSGKILDCLRKADSDSLLSLSMSVFTKMDIALLQTWTPTKEPVGPDAFLTECPNDLFARNQQRNLPSIVGVVREEMPAALVAFSAKENDKDWYTKAAYQIREVVGMVLGSPDLVERVNQFYFKGVLYNFTSFWSPEEQTMFLSYRMDFDYWFHMARSFEDLLKDIYYYHPAVRVLEQQRQNSIYPSYFYYFEFKGACSFCDWYGDDYFGGGHGDELLHLFPYHPSDCAGGKNLLSIGKEGLLTVRTMVELWTSFAIQGVPRASRVDNWVPYDDEGHYLKIGSRKDPTITLKSNFNTERMRFWGNTTLQICD